MMKVSLIKIISIHACIQFAKSCEKSEGHCCVGHYQDEDGICRECPLGTFGINCTSSCVSGYFGKFCQNPCNCSANECDVKYGCQRQTVITSFPSSILPLTYTFQLSDSPTSPITEFKYSIWKRTAILLIGVLAVVLLFKSRKTCSLWVVKRRNRTAEIQQVLVRAQRTGNGQVESVVNLPDESNIASFNGNVHLTHQQKRCSSPTPYHEPNDDYAYIDECKTNVVQHHYEEDWREKGMLLAKPIDKLMTMSKRVDEEARKPNSGFCLSSEDKFQPYSSMKYSRYSQKVTSNRGQAPQKGSSVEPNNDYDDVAPYCNAPK